MLIRVIYQNYTYDYVKPDRLDTLIEMHKVAMFRRSTGWAIVGIDPLRRKKYAFEEVKDRRQPRP